MTDARTTRPHMIGGLLATDLVTSKSGLNRGARMNMEGVKMLLSMRIPAGRAGQAR